MIGRALTGLGLFALLLAAGCLFGWLMHRMDRLWVRAQHRRQLQQERERAQADLAKSLNLARQYRIIERKRRARPPVFAAIERNHLRRNVGIQEPEPRRSER